MTDTLVSTREVPWMKLGKLTDEPMTAREAAEAGGLNFTVSKRPLAFGTQIDLPDSEVYSYSPIKERVAVVRDDTNVWLGLMSDEYPLLQFGEAFDFMDTVGSRYVAAGALRHGRQGFMVVKAPDDFKVLGGADPHDLYAILRTSHDGSRAVEVSVQPLRQRCMNQLTLQSFTAGVPYRWAIPHTSSMMAKLAEAQKSLTNIGKYADAYTRNVERLAKIKLTQDEAVKTLEAVLPDRPRRPEQIDRITTAWHTSETVGFDWTGWGMLNAVSDYFEWGRVGGSAESRFIGALQGQTHQVINRVAGRLLSRA